MPWTTPGAPRGARPPPLVGTAGGPREGRPLVVVTAAGGRAGGESAGERANEWSEARHACVVPVLVLGFGREGSYRARGLALADRFAERFGTVSLIDNQAIDEHLLVHVEAISLRELWDGTIDHALARIERVIVARRDV